MSKAASSLATGVLAFLIGGVSFQLVNGAQGPKAPTTSPDTQAVQKGSPADKSSNKPPLMVNITRGKSELHAVSMAVGLAQAAIKDGRTAIVFLNVDAPVFAAKNLGDDVKFADFPPVKRMLRDFMAMGGRVLVCGHCAHVIHLKPEDMMDGVKFLAHGELFDSLSPGTLVFSY